MLTPSTPSLAASSYRLRAWSAAQADDLIASLNERAKYLDLIRTTMGGPPYHIGYANSAKAEQEALLRFPEDARAARWRMDALAHVTYSTYARGGELYRDFVVNALNSGEVNVDDVQRWLYTYPTELTFELDQFAPPPGYENSHILNISEYGVGGTSIWLLGRDGHYSAYLLFDRLGVDFSTDYEVDYADLTGDGTSEVVSYLGNHNGTFRGGGVGVYDLSQAPPVALSIGLEASWVMFDGLGGIDIQHDPNGTLWLHLPANPTSNCLPSTDYWLAWNGQWLDVKSVSMNFHFGDAYQCRADLDYFDFLSFPERQALLAGFESAFNDGPPTGLDPATGEAYPPDEKDALRYELALRHALLGQRDEALAYLDKMLAAPSPDSQWVEPAQRFIDQYQSPTDVYRVCVHAVIECDLSHALEQVVRSLDPANMADISTALADRGVTILADGWLSTDEASPVRWIALHDPNKRNAVFWVIAESQSGLRAVDVGTLSTGTPQVVVYTPYGGGPAIDYSLLFGNSPELIFGTGTSDVYALIRRRTDQEPYVARLTSRTPAAPTAAPPTASSMTSDAVDDLLAGASPASIVDRLISIADRPDFESSNFYHYFLGLAYELAGDEENAIKTYVETWQSCCQEFWSSPGEVFPDPYAIMARAKLEPRP